MPDAAQVVIVGAGLAGGAAALALAQARRRPILVDPGDGGRGDPSGDGILAAVDLPSGIPEGFPLERSLSDRRLALLGAASWVSVDFQEPVSPRGGPPASFVRARTDPWLSAASEAAGAELRSGRVDRLSRTGRGVDGIVLDGRPLPAALTILADGPRATELAAEIAPLPRSARAPATILATERLALLSSRLEERFDLSPGMGASLHGMLGWVPPPRAASGFLVTHRDSVTVGIRIEGASAPEEALGLLRSFHDHPSIAPLLDGAAPVPGSARTTTTAARRRVSAGPGWLLSGDAAGCPSFRGAVLRGRNLAWRSGWLAGMAAAQALARNGSPRPDLSGPYRRLVRSERWDADGADGRDPLIGDPRIHGSYPDLLASVLHRLMTESGGPKEPVTAALRASRRASGRSWRSIARDAAGAARRL